MSESAGKDKISVVIPAYNSEEYLPKCLEGVLASSHKVDEIVVISDGSTDSTVEIAQRFGAKTVHFEKNNSANYCRNYGAEIAVGDILLFMDSDVVCKADTVKNIIDVFQNENVDAVVGLYAVSDKYKNLSSRYKNLWIRFSYLKSKSSIDWIFGAISAIRKKTFFKINGFSSELHSKAGIDDLELGKRMKEHDYKITLNHTVEVEHLKNFTFWSLMRNELHRSLWFVVLAAKKGQISASPRKGFVNIYPGFIHSTILAWLIIFSGIAGFILNLLWIILIPLIPLYLVINLRFLKFFGKHYGFFSTFGALAVLFSDHVICAIGSMLGILRWISSKTKK